ncbi:EF-hand domain-containing protein [Desulfolithobacter sp.]
MKVTRSLIAAAFFSILALGAGVEAQATDLSRPGPLSFSDYDLDSNGVITEQELNTVREQRQAALKASGRRGIGIANAPSFADLDSNGDGQITPEELRASRKAMWEKRGRGRGMGRGMGR